MDTTAHYMASKIPSGVDLSDPSAVAVALVAAGFRGSAVADYLDEVISIAKAERDSYGVTNAILDCVETASIFTR